MPFLLGLTGNIGCGKSTVGRLLAERFGADYVDADVLVHRLYAAGTPETRAIAARFGADLVQADGTIDRRRLGDIVMADQAALTELNGLLREGIVREIDGALNSSQAPVVVLDAIRLIEAGLYRRCQAVWVVVCDADEQERRLMATRGFSEEQARLRITAQRPQAEKVPYATEVIENRGDLATLESTVAAAWERDVAPKLAAPA